jgi:putative MATE family efflux protein
MLSKEPESSKIQIPPILTAPVAPLFIRMALPIIFGLLINGLFNFVDAIFISRAVGTDAIGGVSAAFPIQMIMISLSAMLGSGMASIISRRLGANQDEEASMVFSASLVLAAIVGLTLSIIIVYFRLEIFQLMQLPSDLVPYAVDYLTPIAAIGLISFCHGTMSECLRAQGLNGQVFKLMASMALLNIALDALFLLVFEWGVPGAAWATALSITMAFFYAFYLLKTGDHRVKFTFSHFRFIPKVHKEAIGLGIPVFLSYTGFAMMLLIVNITLVKVAGTDAQLLISAHGVLNRVFMLIFLPVLGMMIAFQTFAGFNYGAQKTERVIQVLKVALIATAGYAAVWSAIMIFLPEYLFQLFSEDQALVQAAADISSIVFIGFITVGIAMICPALFQAIGFAKPAAFLNALHTYFLLLPALGLYSILLGTEYGAEGIWWLFPIIDGITAIIVGLYTWYFINRLKTKLTLKSSTDLS